MVSKRTRRRLSAAEQVQLWERWNAGEPASAIALALERAASSVKDVLARHGGIAPAARRRSDRCLQLAEREQIGLALCRGESLRSVARRLGRAASSISREIARNGGTSDYRAAEADQRAWQRALRPKRCRLACHARLRRQVASKLAQRWSPEQISGWLARRYPNDQSRRVSAETIYKSLFIQARGVLKKQFLDELRAPRSLRYPQAQGRQGKGRKRGGNGQISDELKISERPAQAEDRAVPGHWEGDLLAGTVHSHIATLVERRSRFVMLVKLDSRDSQTVVDALSKQILRLPKELRRSLTWDRGAEMSQHKRFSLETDLKVYFCDPHSPWQRGSNENTNGLLRQYFPKGKSLKPFTQRQLDAVAAQLNGRPRQTLGFRTPAEVFNETVASTG